MVEGIDGKGDDTRGEAVESALPLKYVIGT